MEDSKIILERLALLEALILQVSHFYSLPAIPVLLRDAAVVCNVEIEWLRDRVQWKDIPAYRSGAKAPWRVYVADVVKFMTQETNTKPVKRLRRAA